MPASPMPASPAPAPAPALPAAPMTAPAASNHPARIRPLVCALGAFALLLAAAGCGTIPPTDELVDARKAYAQAAQGEAKELVPDRLLTAEQALKAAEAEENEDPGSPKARTMAYVAHRKALLAETFARITAANQAKTAAKATYESELETRYEQAQAALGKTSERLVQTRGTLSEREQQLAAREDELATREKELALRTAELDQRNQEISQRNQEISQRDELLSRQQKELARERAAREAAEARYQAAVKSLEEVVQVREEARGTVLTLSGAVLFGSGKAQLLPVARQQLGQVALALAEVEENQKRITVEGHTDARGSRRSNQRLSKRRADAVRRYLVEQGVPARRIRAVGKGEDTPIADNASPDGRAQNRRVEIVITDADG